MLIVVILLAAFIVVPLLDLTLQERVRSAVKIAVYLLTFLYVLLVLLRFGGQPW